MPLLHLHLLRCAPGRSLASLMAALRSESSITVIVAARPQYTVIAPVFLDRAPLLSQPWDLLVLLQSAAAALPATLRPLVAAQYTVACGIPSRLLGDYPARNAALRAQPPPPPTGSLEAALQQPELPGGERLEVNRELLRFMDAFERRHGGHMPVTMLNLLSFHRGGKESYARYGQAFVEVAGRRGGDAKLVGNVVVPQGSGASSASGSHADHQASQPNNAQHGGGGGGGWDEVSIVHYPSIRSFCDMLAGEDYQEINEKYRVNALRDTFLLCTTENLDLAQPTAARL